MSEPTNVTATPTSGGSSASPHEHLPFSISSLVFIRDWGILVLLGALLLVFGVWHGSAFLSKDNAMLMLDEAARTFPFAAGVAIGALGGALDLSVPGVAAVVNVSVGKMLKSGLPIPIALFLGLVIAAAIGCVNGTITLRGFNPLVVTIGTLSLLTGAATIISNSYTIPGLDMLSFMGTDRHFGIALQSSSPYCSSCLEPASLRTPAAASGCWWSAATPKLCDVWA